MEQHNQNQEKFEGYLRQVKDKSIYNRASIYTASQIRMRLISRLAKLGGLQAIKPLMKIVQDSTESIRVRNCAVYYLGLSQDTEVAQFLIKLLEDDVMSGYVGAVLTLMGSEIALFPLLHALNSPNKVIQEAAATNRKSLADGGLYRSPEEQ